MKKLIFIMLPVLILTNQVKSQDNINRSSFENVKSQSNGNVTDDVRNPAVNSLNEGYIRNSSDISVIQNRGDSSVDTENYEPIITVTPEFLHQDGNYLGTCAPPMTYVVNGRYLTENLIIYDNYSGSAFVSLTGQNDYVSTLTLVPVNGVVDTTIYVRHCPDFSDNYTYLNHSSSGVEVNLLVETDPVAGNAPVSTLGQVEAEPGSEIRVPVTATNFEYISEIQYVIEFDPTVLSFIDVDTYLYLVEAYATVIEISPYLSQLNIYVVCPSDVYMEAPDNEKILDLLFNYNAGSTNLTFGDCSFQNIFLFYPNDEPASDYYFNGSVSSSVRSTSVYLNLEGLYNPDSGHMNQAMGETEAFFKGEVSDQVTVKLASESAAYSTVFEIDSVEVDQDGHCRFNVPAIYNGNYYLAVSHRNSIETWSAIPVSFSDSVVQYDFTTSASQAYGNNMKSIGDTYNIYAGDVNQDGMVDTEDMTPVDNQASVYATGYLITDVNGDGIIDTWDMTLVENNAVQMIGKIFPSSDALPVLTTDSITDITIVSAVCLGSVLQQGSSQLTAKGVCWDTSPEPTIANSHTVEAGAPGFFESLVTGLIPNTLYYIRAYATNNNGTSYGNEMSFNSSIFSPGEGVTDIDNNHYLTVIIGYQEWMAENLDVTHYRNGDPIPNVTDNAEWSNLTTGAFCWYNNDETAYSNTYGALYNWHAVIDTRGLCPEGWHVPSDSDWAELITNYLGGMNIAGEKIKADSGWDNNSNGNNISGFSGLPGGLRYYLPFLSFNSLGIAAGWWSSTEEKVSTAMYRYIAYPASNFKENGYSVRCLKD